MEIDKIDLLNILEVLSESKEIKTIDIKPVVYILDNEETNKYYIGATIKNNIRRKEHLNALNNGSHRNPNLQKAFDENPNFKWKEFETDNAENAFKIEKVLIKECRDDSNCLNIRGGTEPAMLNRKTSEETKALQSKIAKERIANGWKTPITGKKLSEETKQHLSETRKKLFKEGFINPFTGKTHSKENKLKQSNLIKSQWEDPAFQQTRYIKVSIDGIIYESIKDASIKLNIPYMVLYERLRNPNFPTYFSI